MSGFAEVSIELKATHEGGRRTGVWLGEDAEGPYRPHFVVHGGSDEYLGVEFVDGPDRMVSPGEGAYATVRFLYEPDVSYDALCVGAAFDICEGGRVVGRGYVVRR